MWLCVRKANTKTTESSFLKKHSVTFKEYVQKLR